MAILQGTIVDTGQTVDIEVPTARVPELPAFSDIADDDEIAAWDQSDNKTKHMSVSQLRAKINGDAIPETPVLSGADMEIRVPAELVGQKRIDIPALAGYTYSLTRRGIGRMATDEFNTLSTGGFELTGADDVFYPGDLFFAHIYELEGGSTEEPGGGTGNGFITGIKTVTISTTLAVSDLSNLINISGDAIKVVLTLPKLEDIPENTIIPIETMVNNQFQSTVTTQSGQFIYFRGTGLQKVYMGKGEVIWVLAGADGWYVINAYGNFFDVGHAIAGYSNTLNTITADGQLVDRDAYPRLWEYAQTTGSGLVSDAVWLSDPDGQPIYRGCFSTGNGTTTFRIPDHRGITIRHLDRGRGLEENERTYNSPGGYQGDLVRNFLPGSGYDRLLRSNTGPNTAATFEPGGRPATWPDISTSQPINTAVLGSENTVKNIGLIGLIKV